MNIGGLVLFDAAIYYVHVIDVSEDSLKRSLRAFRGQLSFAAERLDLHVGPPRDSSSRHQVLCCHLGQGIDAHFFDLLDLCGGT